MGVIARAMWNLGAFDVSDFMNAARPMEHHMQDLEQPAYTCFVKNKYLARSLVPMPRT